jgi:HlyD family secretion protein
MKKVGIVVVIIVVAAVVFFVVRNGKGSKDENGIETFPVERGTIVDKALAIGEIGPKHRVAVKSKISGIVSDMFVEMGDRVDVGSPLANIAPDPTPIEYADAKRSMEIAVVGYEAAQANFERVEGLLKKGLVSQREYDEADREFRQSELRMQLAEEKLALIDSGKTRIANRDVESVVKSPIQGVVLERFVDEGDPVVPLTSYQAGTALFNLANMEDLIFTGTVDEIDVGKLEESMPVRIKVGALPDQKVEGILYRISPQAKKEENTTLFDLEIHITSTGGKPLRAGYSANADIIITEKRDVLITPERLVHFDTDSTWVEVQEPDQSITRRHVVTGLSDGLQVEIAEGLQEGDLVVERPPKEIE